MACRKSWSPILRTGISFFLKPLSHLPRIKGWGAGIGNQGWWQDSLVLKNMLFRSLQDSSTGLWDRKTKQISRYVQSWLCHKSNQEIFTE